MSDAPSSARAVVIGCGIVGNSLAYHLSRLGWEDIVLLDKGPLPNPGGSTGHASNFIFPVDHSKEMTQLTLESQRQYVELGVNTECGGIEVARSEERMQELRRGGDQTLVFEGAKLGRPMSDMTLTMLLRRLGVDATAHGFRSSFRDWAAEATNFPREVAEAALAHAVETVQRSDGRTADGH